MNRLAKLRPLLAGFSPANLNQSLAELKAWKRSVLLILLGLFAGLSAAPLHVFPALIIGLTALVWALDHAHQSPKPLRAAFWRSFLFAWAYLGVGVFWVAFAFFNRGGAFIVFGPLVAVLGAAFLALFWALAGVAYVRLGLKGPVRILAFACLFLIAEAAKGLPFTQFPWNIPAHIWPAGGSVSQSAALFGAWGLSFFTLILCAAPAALVGAGSVSFRRLPLAAISLVFVLLFSFGAYRLANATLETHPDLLFRIVDIDVDQQDKWSPGGGDRLRSRYLEMTASPGVSEVTHIIWPEGALPLFLLEDGPSISSLSEILTEGQTLIAGTPRRERGEAPGDVSYYNSMVALTFQGERPRVTALYDKVYLVPFGEFVPFSGFLGSLGIQSLTELVAGYSPGIELITLDSANAPPFMPLICYEVVFSGLRPENGTRPEWLLSLSNDAWFGPTAGPAQHLNIARYRAIEQGLPMVRAASRGYSGVIDPYGQMPTRIDRRANAASDVRLPLPLAPTLYAATGGLLFWLIFAIVLILIGYAFYRQKHW